MPELEFSLDAETGDFTMHIEGVVGPACEDVATLVKNLAGEPHREEATAEYQLRPRVERRVENRVRVRRG